MSRDLSTKIIIYRAVDGRIRLTTRHGVTFDATLVRWEYDPKRVALIEPIGFTLPYGEFVPEVLRLTMNQLADVARVEGPAPTPDLEKLRKAIEWPVELAPKSTAASLKRAEQALAAANTADEAAAAVQLALDTGATKGLPAAVARLAPDTRKQLARTAAETGAGDVLSILLAGAEGLDLNWLLVRAAARGKVHSVAALLRAGADVDAVAPLEPGAQYSRGLPHSVLYWAVAQGQRSVVRQLLAAGARVTDSAGLAWAVVGAPDDVIWALLIAHGLDVDARDHHGNPLLLALGMNRQDRMLAAALAAGADVNATYADGSTLLLHAIALAMEKDRSTSFIEALLRAGADPNAGRLDGRNPLALARVVRHDPGAFNGERWIERWLAAAGAVAIEDAGAPAIPQEKPPELPPWQAHIDATLTRTDHYEIQGIRFTPRAGMRAEMSAVPGPTWSGLGSDTIALVRAKLEHLVGPPHDRGDEYKTTFEYSFVATVDGVDLALHVCDWKAREIAISLAAHPDAALRERVAAAFVELLTRSPLAAFRDHFRYDGEARRVYRSDGRTALAEFAK
jgi:hypothetical protein